MGSSFSVWPNTYWNSRATQKVGMETPHREKVISVWSSKLPRLTAEMMPVGMPIHQETIRAQRVSLTVLGKASIIISVTSRFFIL